MRLGPVFWVLRKGRAVSFKRGIGFLSVRFRHARTWKIGKINNPFTRLSTISYVD
jgi:hypothetical protein